MEVSQQADLWRPSVGLALCQPSWKFGMMVMTTVMMIMTKVMMMVVMDDGGDGDGSDG